MRIKSNHSRLSLAVTITILALFAIAALVPFYFLLISSFKPGVEMIRNGISLNPHFEKFTLGTYISLFTDPEGKYFYWYKNSLTITTLATVLGLILSSMVGYGMGMYSFKLRNLVLVLVMCVMMTPLEILILPLYKEINSLGLIDKNWGVVIPFVVSSSSVFFFRQYSLGLPKELMESGRIDGLTEFGIFTRIMVPLMRPAYGAMAILIAMGSWNAVVWPLIVLRDGKKLTLPIGLATMITPYGNNYDMLMPGAVLAVIPIVILYIFNQKSFVAGLTIGSVKG